MWTELGRADHAGKGVEVGLGWLRASTAFSLWVGWADPATERGVVLAGLSG